METFVTHGQCNGTVRAPSRFQAVAHSFFGMPETSFPFRDTQGQPQSGNETIVATVLLLRSWQRPLYIANFVMSVCVYPVYRMFVGRPCSAFGKKVLERIKAKLDTSATIIRIVLIVRILATGFRRFPRTILRGAPPTHSVSVGKWLATRFLLQASTRLRLARLQAIAHYNRQFTTQAFAQPFHIASKVLSGEANNVQSSKMLIAQIFNSFIEMWVRVTINSRHLVKDTPLIKCSSRVDWMSESFQLAF